MFLKIVVVACFAMSIASAQDIQYVSAENGLIVREKPNQGANRVGLLDYGTAVEVVEHTNLNLDIKDNNQKISGEWVKIRGTEAYEFFEEGYVFNGFLTEKKIKKPLKVAFDEFTVFIDQLDEYVHKDEHFNAENAVAYDLELGETPEGRYIKIQQHQEYRTIEVFQRHQNSVTIMNEGPHCDLLDYKHYNSSWKPLKMVTSSNNVFKTLTFLPEDYKRFVEVNMNDLKAYVKAFCGDKWYQQIENSKSVHDYPIGVSVSQIHLRIVMTDIDGYKTEKIIIFDIPMGC